jgi:hypothetical protein
VGCQCLRTCPAFVTGSSAQRKRARGAECGVSLVNVTQKICMGKVALNRSCISHSPFHDGHHTSDLSTSIFTKTHLPLYLSESSSNTGDIIRHGPHQGAQKSIHTCTSPTLISQKFLFLCFLFFSSLLMLLRLLSFC